MKLLRLKTKKYSLCAALAIVFTFVPHAAFAGKWTGSVNLDRVYVNSVNALYIMAINRINPVIRLEYNKAFAPKES